MLSRAIHGVPVPHYYKGEQVGEHRRYNDRLAMFLLRYRNPILYGKFNDTKDYGAPDEYFAVHLAHMANKVENGVENIYEARHDLDEEEDDTP